MRYLTCAIVLSVSSGYAAAQASNGTSTKGQSLDPVVKDEICHLVGSVMSDAATQRDARIPLMQAIDDVRKNGRKARLSPGTIRVHEQLVQQIYATTVTPDQAYRDGRKHCEENNGKANTNQK